MKNHAIKNRIADFFICHLPTKNRKVELSKFLHLKYQIIISDEVFGALNAVVLYLENIWSKNCEE